MRTAAVRENQNCISAALGPGCRTKTGTGSQPMPSATANSVSAPWAFRPFLSGHLSRVLFLENGPVREPSEIPSDAGLFGHALQGDDVGTFGNGLHGQIVRDDLHKAQRVAGIENTADLHGA